VFCATFIELQFGFVIFCHKNIGSKAARKMLVKLIKGVQEKSTVLGHRQHKQVDDDGHCQGRAHSASRYK